MISWITGKMWQAIASTALIALAGLGIWAAILSHERDVALREKSEIAADFAQFQLKSAEVISERLLQNAKDQRALEDATRTAMDNYQKGKIDAQKSYATANARIKQLRIPTEAGSDSRALPDYSAPTEGTTVSCESRLRNAAEQFNAVVGAVAEVSNALKAAQEEALTLKALVGYEKARDWPKPQ